MRAVPACLYVLACFISLNLVALIAFTALKWDSALLLQRGIYSWRETTFRSSTLAYADNAPTASQSLRVEAKDCLEKSGELLGRIDVNVSLAEYTYWKESNFDVTGRINKDSKDLGKPIPTEYSQEGYFSSGHAGCLPSRTVAIIIPFRDRESHLRTLLGHLVPILRRQFVRFSVFVAEQAGNETFNKGRLMNTAFQFATKAAQRSGIPFDCYIFHDVDLLSEDDTLLYECPEGEKITHLATRIDKFGYRSMCCGITVGGVLAMKEDLFRKVNGYSISYWGWGAEDDDMDRRIKAKGIEIVRPAPSKGRFTMIPHVRNAKNPKNPDRLRLLGQAVKRMETDGLRNLTTTIAKVEKFPLFTKLLVDVGKSKP